MGHVQIEKLRSRQLGPLTIIIQPMQIDILDYDANKSKASSFSAKHPMFSLSETELPQGIGEWLRSFENFVVVGMGGSSLPLKAFVDAAQLQDRIHFLDRLSSVLLDRFLKLPKVLFCIVSKSGETLEVHTLLRELQIRSPEQGILIVTDPQNGSLRKLVNEKKLKSIAIPQSLGGRFTHFSPFHRALLERLGVDFSSLVMKAKLTVESLKKDPSPLEGLYRNLFEYPKSHLILFAYGDRLLGLCEWIQQAIAESLGKRSSDGKRLGIFPIVLKGPQDQHSVLQLLMDGPQNSALWFFGTHSDGSRLAAIQSLLEESSFQSFKERLANPETHQPLARWTFEKNLEEVAEAIVTIDAFIEYASERQGINAYDQPGVERGKQIARDLMSK